MYKTFPFTDVFGNHFEHAELRMAKYADGSKELHVLTENDDRIIVSSDLWFHGHVPQEGCVFISKSSKKRNPINVLTETGVIIPTGKVVSTRSARSSHVYLEMRVNPEFLKRA